MNHGASIYHINLKQIIRDKKDWNHDGCILKRPEMEVDAFVHEYKRMQSIAIPLPKYRLQIIATCHTII